MPVDPPDNEELQKKFEEWRASTIEKFPFETVTVNGAEALAAWGRLKSSNGAIPVVIGNEESFGRVAEGAVSPDLRSAGRETAGQIIALADALHHPQDLRAMHRKIYAEIRASAKELGLDFEIPETNEPAAPLGRWPWRAPAGEQLTVASEYGMFGGKFGSRISDKVYIALIPTDDWTTIPAHLNWGGWNENPPAEYHVAALRSWRDRYGAELAGMSGDVMNIRVARKPSTREEALELAREQYEYCNDIVDQGVETLSKLAAGLYAHHWWYFWWD